VSSQHRIHIAANIAFNAIFNFITTIIVIIITIAAQVWGLLVSLWLQQLNALSCDMCPLFLLLCCV
jgi:phage-related protein